jgi:hypothetical protein
VREQRPVRQRELEVPGDQDRFQGLAGRVEAVGHDRDRLDRREVDPLEVAQEVVFAFGDPFRRLLDRVDRAGEPDEAHDVPGDAAGEGDELVGRPLLQRRRPRKVEQRRVDEGRGDPHVFQHDGSQPRDAADRGSLHSSEMA